jgi:hypothetical protein
MAKIFYEVLQNKNEKSLVKGKWFAHSKSVETMNTRKLAKHKFIVQLIASIASAILTALGATSCVGA